MAYLAAKYMSGPKADAILARSGSDNKKKKKKKKLDQSGPAASSSRIADDDGAWGNEAAREEEEDLKEAVVASDRSFKKTKRTVQWTMIREGDNPPTPEPVDEDEKPQVVEEETPFKGGLVTSAQLKKRLPQKQAVKKEEPSEQEQETIYRDASGRQIDINVERAEAARKKREWEEKEASKMEWGKGLVQREEAEKRRADLEAEKTRSFARYANDETLNEQQRSIERWNDPAAAFLTKQKSKGPRRPEYNGPTPPPNRFGIKPGYRWDGVGALTDSVPIGLYVINDHTDRGNGFEAKLFQRLNERDRSKLDSYQWSVEDM